MESSSGINAIFWASVSFWFSGLAYFALSSSDAVAGALYSAFFIGITGGVADVALALSSDGMGETATAAWAWGANKTKKARVKYFMGAIIAHDS